MHYRFKDMADFAKWLEREADDARKAAERYAARSYARIDYNARAQTYAYIAHIVGDMEIGEIEF